MKRTYKFFAGLALFALLLTGCNSGGPSEGGSSGGGGGGSDNPPVAEDSYTIIWKNWNGTTLETDNNVKKGTTPMFIYDYIDEQYHNVFKNSEKF